MSNDLNSLDPEAFYEQVCRTRLDAPGYALIDLGPSFEPLRLRQLMVDLKEKLNELLQARLGKSLEYLSAGRFDQRNTTKFHLDGAPDESLLMLGYEPTPVMSQLFIADYTKAALHLGLTPKQFLEQRNPMFPQGERALDGYFQELTNFRNDHHLIVLINNSRSEYQPDGNALLGVMHKAVVINPELPQPRWINSTMIGVYDSPNKTQDALTHEDIQKFITNIKMH